MLRSLPRDMLESDTELWSDNIKHNIQTMSPPVKKRN